MYNLYFVCSSDDSRVKFILLPRWPRRQFFHNVDAFIEHMKEIAWHLIRSIIAYSEIPWVKRIRWICRFSLSIIAAKSPLVLAELNSSSRYLICKPLFIHSYSCRNFLVKSYLLKYRWSCLCKFQKSGCRLFIYADGLGNYAQRTENVEFSSVCSWYSPAPQANQP